MAMDQIPETAIPAPVRKWGSWILGGASVVVGSCVTAYAALELGQPDWLRVSVAVVPYAAGALGLSAGIHAPNKRTSEAAGEGSSDAASQVLTVADDDGIVVPETIYDDSGEDEPEAGPKRAEAEAVAG